MHWIEKTTIDELESACPELGHLSINSDATTDEILNMIRDDLATSYGSYRPNIQRFPEFGPDGLPIHNDVEHFEHKDYSKKEVKEFDEKKSKYWGQIKLELHSLICTDDEKYDEARKKLGALEEKGSQAVVAIVSATIGKALGIAAGAISGLIAVLIFVVLRIGVNAYCSLATQE